MNLNFIKDAGNQLLAIWRDIKTYQKFTVVMVLMVLVGMLSFLVMNAASSRYTPLYPSERLLISDAAEVKAHLDSSRVPYKIQGDTTIMVPEDQVHTLRMDLASVGLPKMHSSKGFELFDSNTWIKGEKELQVLEMRALKGQLETDIGEFENIREASVILDIAPPRPFGGSMYKTKASVILNLMPGARLNTSQLRSITFHVAGAVRGLTPNMVAISDTSGKLYQAIDPDGTVDMLRSAEVAVEERLKAKVDGMLAMVVGHDSFYSTVQVSMSREKMSQEQKIYSGTVDGTNLGDAVMMSVTESGMSMTEKEHTAQGTPGTNNEAIAGAILGGAEVLNRDENRNQMYRQMAVPVSHLKVNSTPGKIESISIGVMIDKTITVDAGADLPPEEIVDGRRNTEQLREEVQKQLGKILEGYAVRAIPAVDFVEFDKTRFSKKVKEESWSSMMATVTSVGTVFFVVLTVLGMFWTFNRFWRRHMMLPPTLEKEEEEEETLEFAAEPSLVEVEAMVESVKMRFQNDPGAVVQTIRDWLTEEAGAPSSK